MVERRRTSRRAGAPAAVRRYPRIARVNHLLQEVIATELERLAADDPRLALITVMSVEADGDLRHATVWLSSLSDDAAVALADDRIRLQAAIARQVRLKRTPLLTFEPDPAVVTGARIEEIIREIGPFPGDGDPDGGETYDGDPDGGDPDDADPDSPDPDGGHRGDPEEGDSDV